MPYSADGKNRQPMLQPVPVYYSVSLALHSYILFLCDSQCPCFIKNDMVSLCNVFNGLCIAQVKMIAAKDT